MNNPVFENIMQKFQMILYLVLKISNKGNFNWEGGMPLTEGALAPLLFPPS